MGYVVVDIETTGLSRHKHRITEIAAARIDGEKVVDEFHTLINPGVHIPSFITSLTGISDDMVRDKPKIHKIIPHFLNFLKDDIIIAHNATFDYNFLAHNAECHCDCALTNDRICTRLLANRLVPELPSKKLGMLCEYFGIVNENAHRARADVFATVEVFNRFQQMLQEKGIHNDEDILKFQRS